MLAAYASELHALKTELQSTLARLGIDPTSSDDADMLSTTETPETRRNSRRSRRSGRTRSITRWNRRQLTQELAVASERRRELEMELQRVMERQEQDTQEQERRTRRTSAYHDAITALQRQRQEILRQMEQDTAIEESQEAEQGGATQHNRQHQGFPMGNNDVVSETHYSIGGVVTLELLSSSQQLQGSSSRSEALFQPVAAAPAVASAPVPVPTTVPSVLDAYPRYRTAPDALNDVFSLQLKFAETMLKLEESVQIRDQLLHHGSLPKRRTTQAREENDQVRRRGRQLQRRKRSESGCNSDSSVVMHRENHSSESFSSSSYSCSSLDSTVHRSQTIRVRYPNFEISRATTAETLAPSSLGAYNSPDNGAAAPVSSNTATTLSPQETSNTLDETAEHRRTSDSESAPSVEEETHRTPTTGSSVTTPTTGSDQKSAASSSKQVRFGDDAYSTPVIARKFNFDGPSIDEDEDEEKHEEADSVLSFLGGSSVTSAELNDASFLRAFERFRRELQVSKHDGVLQLPSQPPLARKLFPAPSVALPTSNANEVVRTVEPHDNTVETTTQPDNAEAFPALIGLSVQELQERRRQLCLDIQAESAHLVLSFGAMQSATSGSQDSEQMTFRLLELRDELKAVDARLNSLR